MKLRDTKRLAIKFISFISYTSKPIVILLLKYLIKRNICGDKTNACRKPSVY